MIALALGLAGCEVPKEVNPVYIYREVSGLADAERLPPPGLDQPFPNLASVPPRPERPPLALREAISADLAADRAGSREPWAPARLRRGSAAAAASRGGPSVPAGPPPRAALAVAPAIPWTERAPAAAGPPGGGAQERAAPRGPPARPGQAAPLPSGGGAAPAQAPGLPTPSAPPPPPSPDLLGLPQSPDPSGPPALPPPDLLAPPRLR